MEKTKDLTWNEIPVGQYVRPTSGFCSGYIIRKTSPFSIENGCVQSAIIIKDYRKYNESSKSVALSNLENETYDLVTQKDLKNERIF